MNRLEEKIASINNHQSEPLSGHRERFEKKLTNQKTKQRNLSWKPMALASSVVLIFSLSILYFSNKTYSVEQAQLIIENEEFIESEQYYQQQIAIKLATIEELNRDEQVYSNDLADFDESLEVLKEDLREAPGDPRVVEAVLNTYMLKVEALDNIVTILKKIS